MVYICNLHPTQESVRKVMESNEKSGIQPPLEVRQHPCPPIGKYGNLKDTNFWSLYDPAGRRDLKGWWSHFK